MISIFRRSTLSYVVRRCCALGGAAILFAALLLAAVGARAGEWTNWRGPNQDGSSPETGLLEAWNPKGGDGSNVVWKRSDLGTRSSPIVMRGKLYVLVRDKPESADEREKVSCVDAATGHQIWQHRFHVDLTEVPDTRVAWSSVVGDPATGRVYAQGVCGYFCCLDGETGKVVWERSLHEELGVITTFGGRTNVPVVCDDLVLISAVLVSWGDTPDFDGLARPAHRFMAFDKATGELRWLSSTSVSPPDTTYATPYVGVVGGEAQLIFGAADGMVWSLQPRTGKMLWNYPLSIRGLNVSPLVSGGMVYTSHSEENLTGTTSGAVVALDAKLRGSLAGKAKWLTKGIMSGKSSPVMVDGKLWTIDDRAKLHILDPETGKEVGKKALGAVMRSTPVAADGKVYACTNSGQWYILKPSGNGAEIIHKLRLPKAEVDGSPAIAEGRIFLPTSEGLYCVSAKESAKPAASTSHTPGPVENEPSLSADQQPATLQLSPYDVTLKPGGVQKYTARLYNARGQFLKIVPADEAALRVVGPGEASADGTYKAPARSGHDAALVFCKVGALESKARVRIVPPLPWLFDFEKEKDMPITWVGGRIRYAIQEIDGERAAMKKSTLPTPKDPKNKLGTDSKMFMGPSDLHNYTVQADVRITETNGRLPDAGLINCGYTLCLRSQQADALQLYSWSAHDFRTRTSAKFAAEPDKWYRMKLRVQQQQDTALVQGKAWLRDQPEPQKWSVEMTDHTPIRHGSPGLYGKTSETEFYVDNFSVTANEAPAEAETQDEKSVEKKK